MAEGRRTPRTLQGTARPRDTWVRADSGYIWWWWSVAGAWRGGFAVDRELEEESRQSKSASIQEQGERHAEVLSPPPGHRTGTPHPPTAPPHTALPHWGVGVGGMGGATRDKKKTERKDTQSKREMTMVPIIHTLSLPSWAVQMHSALAFSSPSATPTQSVLAFPCPSSSHTPLCTPPCTVFIAFFFASPPRVLGPLPGGGVFLAVTFLGAFFHPSSSRPNPKAHYTTATGVWG